MNSLHPLYRKYRNSGRLARTCRDSGILRIRQTDSVPIVAKACVQSPSKVVSFTYWIWYRPSFVPFPSLSLPSYPPPPPPHIPSSIFLRFPIYMNCANSIEGIFRLNELITNATLDHLGHEIGIEPLLMSIVAGYPCFDLFITFFFFTLKVLN